MFEQFETLYKILDQLKKFQFKGTEHQIILFNISNYAFVIRRPTHHSLFKQKEGLEGHLSFVEHILFIRFFSSDNQINSGN